LANVAAEPVLEATYFSPKIHSLLTCYLIDQTPYFTMEDNAEKIVDVFYKFMHCEHPHLMEANLKEGMVVTIGQWFYDEGLVNMFKKYYCTAQDFTYFLAKFMQFGISVLFVAGACVLGNKDLETELK
jgi:hypothetical protein